MYKDNKDAIPVYVCISTSKCEHRSIAKLFRWK